MRFGPQDNAFDVPNSEITMGRKLTMAGIAVTCLVLLGMYMRSDRMSMTSVMNLQNLPPLQESGLEGTLLCAEDTQIISKAYVASKGCAMISDVDLGYTNNTLKRAYVLVVCARQSVGTVPLSAETLESFGLVDSGKSLISSIILGEATTAAVYTGGMFDGDNMYVMDRSNTWEPILRPGYMFLNKWKENSRHNVMSIIFHSTSDSIPTSCDMLRTSIGFIAPSTNFRG
jgi:hypothetical protein